MLLIVSCTASLTSLSHSVSYITFLYSERLISLDLHDYDFDDVIS